MAARQTTKTTITRTVKVEFDQDRVRELLRAACAAPNNAYVEIESWGDATVTWSTQEEEN